MTKLTKNNRGRVDLINLVAHSNAGIAQHGHDLASIRYQGSSKRSIGYSVPIIVPDDEGYNLITPDPAPRNHNLQYLRSWLLTQARDTDTEIKTFLYLLCSCHPNQVSRGGLQFWQGSVREPVQPAPAGLRGQVKSSNDLPLGVAQRHRDRA
jgi:hypothetical protein